MINYSVIETKIQKPFNIHNVLIYKILNLHIFSFLFYIATRNKICHLFLIVLSSFICNLISRKYLLLSKTRLKIYELKEANTKKTAMNCLEAGTN